MPKRWLVAILPKRRWLRRIVIGFAVIIGLVVGTMYGIARWYIWSERNKPLTLGTTFIADYAQSLGLDPHKTLQSTINDLEVRNFRLVSYWNDIEPTPGYFDFTELDWEFQQIAAVHGTVSLSIGLRQPRWPECHAPSWVNTSGAENTWQPELQTFIAAVVNHYKNNPSLQSYQLENEFFLKQFGFFGDCHNFDRSRLVDEFNEVKNIDSKHPIIIARSNNDMGVPLGQPKPDEYGVSVYKRVWVNFVGRYVEYPFPAWFYAFLAGSSKIIDGKDMIIHELQAEPWPPHGMPINQTSLAEQNKSLDAVRLKGRFDYGEGTGIKSIYLWGSEYWYYRMVKLHDPSLWNIAKQEFATKN